MAMTRRQARGGRAFAFPLFGIVVLLTCYWVLTDWHQVPAIINAAITALP